MDKDSVERRLAVIMAADVEGYSRLMGEDEAGTLRALARCRTRMDAIIGRRGGRIANTAGDSVLVEFRSVADAILAALEIQDGIERDQKAASAMRRVRFRIGLNAGDVLVRGGDLFGDSVNITARIQALAPPGGVGVSRTVRDHGRDRVPVLFEDNGLHAVKNIERPLRLFSVRRLDATLTTAPALEAPDRPSIAVLPFDDLAAEAGYEHLVEGVAEEITAALSRIRSFFVIARSSTLAYKGRSVPPAQVGLELGVRYLIKGSIHHSGERVRITAELLDASSGGPLWVERFEGLQGNIFDLQDRLTESLAGAIQPSILSAEIDRARRKRPESLLAYDCVMRAMPMVWPVSATQNEAAKSLLTQALAIDPRYPLALALLAWCHAQAAVYNWSDRLKEERLIAIEFAERAAGLSADEPMVLVALGAAHTVSHNFDTAAAHLERAVAIDPNSAWGWHRLAWLHANQDQANEAIDCFKRSMRLSPLDPMAYVAEVGIGFAHLTADRPLEAIVWLRRGLSRQPDADWAYRYLVPALVLSGRMEEARITLSRLLRAQPALTARKVRDALTFTPRTLDTIVDGLRKAGLPG